MCYLERLVVILITTQIIRCVTTEITIEKLTPNITSADSLFWMKNLRKLIFVDKYQPAICLYEPSSKHFTRINISDGNILSTILPVKHSEDKMVATIDGKLILLTVAHGKNKELSIINTRELITIANEKYILNKGRTDARGRLWVGSRSLILNPEAKGNLYKIDMLESTVMQDDIILYSSAATSKNSKHFYYVDSGTDCIYTYKFNLEKGTIENRKIIFNISDHSDLMGRPCDIAFTTRNKMWIALCAGKAIIEFDPNKQEILRKVDMPAFKPLSLAFGGAGNNVLYVGTGVTLNENGTVYAVSGLGCTGLPTYHMVIPKEYL